MADSKPIQVWRYHLSGGKDQEWAEIVLVSTGMFAAVSDWGDYAYAWRSTGKGIREFFAGANCAHWDYYARKLAHGARVWDGPATVKSVKRFLGQQYRERAIDPAVCRDVLREVRNAEEFEHELSFDDWVVGSVLSETYECCDLAELAVHSFDQDVVQFCQRILPRLAAVIREELAREGEENMLEVKIKLLSPEARMPTKAHASDAGFDLYYDGAHVIRLYAGEKTLLKTGIAVELPEGCEAQVRPRSGMSARGLVAQFGTIDSGYRGEIMVCVNNLSRDVQAIFPGNRIAQLIIAPVPPVTLVEVAELSESDRGENGFGSTGR